VTNMWDIAWGIGAGAYVAGSLVKGMLDPLLGVFFVAAGGARLMWDLWQHYKSLTQTPSLKGPLKSPLKK